MTRLSVQLMQERPIPLHAELDCGPGELVALVGPSGSGKTTILRCIAGLHRPQGGVIKCGGVDWLDRERGVSLSPQHRSCGVVFQHYALFPHMTALQNVAAAMGHRPPRERDARARELLELVHLAGLERRRPAELSGGQQQRVALARALARNPKVLLLDEPFAAVDRVTRRKLQRELAQLRARVKIPILMVTHDLDEARSLADRMYILYRGQTLQQGTPAELMARPASAGVARLLDLANLFEGEVIAHHPDRGRTLIRWLNYAFEAAHAPSFPPGVRVAWVIPAESVILHRRDRPSLGEHENPVTGVVGELVQLGETTSVTIFVNGSADARLNMTIATHHARRNGITTGVTLTASLLATGIHLIPHDSQVAE
jgi:molybdate transport system ATP-binding protein